MTGKQWTIFCIIGSAIAVAGFAISARGSKAPESEPTPAFHKVLLDSAAEYAKYQRIEFVPRRAPTDCRADIAGQPGQSLFASRSGHEDTHGQKLYYLFAKDPKAYLAGKPNPVGQALVKESFKMVEHKDGDKQPAVFHNGKSYQTGDKYALFIMDKLDQATQDTDNGWIYGTVTADGKTVTPAGRVESCMKCHEKTTNDRLFGLPAKK